MKTGISRRTAVERYAGLVAACVLCRASDATRSPAGPPEVPGQPGAGSSSRPWSAKQEPHPVAAGLNSPPILLWYSRPSGQVLADRGVVVAVWMDGQVAFASPQAPGSRVRLGQIGTTAPRQCLEVARRLLPGMQGRNTPQVVMDGCLDVLCVDYGKELKRISCSRMTQPALDEFELTFAALTGMLLRVREDGAPLVENDAALRRRIAALALRGKWED